MLLNAKKHRPNKIVPWRKQKEATVIYWFIDIKQSRTPNWGGNIRKHKKIYKIVLNNSKVKLRGFDKIIRISKKHVYKQFSSYFSFPSSLTWSESTLARHTSLLFGILQRLEIPSEAGLLSPWLFRSGDLSLLFPLPASTDTALNTSKAVMLSFIRALCPRQRSHHFFIRWTSISVLPYNSYIVFVPATTYSS